MAITLAKLIDWLLPVVILLWVAIYKPISKKFPAWGKFERPLAIVLIILTSLRVVRDLYL